MMVWIISILGVAALGAAAMVAQGRFGSMAAVETDDPLPWVPSEGPLTADDIRGARFSLAWRGYEQSQVDALLAQIADSLPEKRPVAATKVLAPQEKGADSTVVQPETAENKE